MNLLNRLLLITLILSLSSCAYDCTMVNLPKNSRTGKLTVTEVIYANGASQNELFRRAHMFLAKRFVNSKAVISYFDKEEGYIIGNGSSDVIITSDLGVQFIGSVSYSLEIVCREGKVQINLSDFIHTGDAKFPSLGTLEKQSNNDKASCVFNYIDTYSRNLMADMKLGLTIPPAEF